MISGTDVEFNTVVAKLESQEELPSSSPDIKRIIIGHRSEIITVVAQPVDKRAFFRAYGAARHLLTLAES